MGKKVVHLKNVGFPGFLEYNEEKLKFFSQTIIAKPKEVKR
jgi:hypothetical protein